MKPELPWATLFDPLMLLAPAPLIRLFDPPRLVVPDPSLKDPPLSVVVPVYVLLPPVGGTVCGEMVKFVVCLGAG